VPGFASPLDDRTALVLLEATGISDGTRLLLLCLIGVLLIILGFLSAFALLIRRRPAPAAQPPPRERSAPASSPPPAPSALTANGALAVARSETMACPTCRRQYESLLEFCPRDARALVPLSQLDARPSGSVCPACRRSSDSVTRFCPHDGSELVPVALYEVTRSDADEEPVGPTGVMGKICPQCRSRHDLAATFCGRDGSELVAIN
jgi:hypothetical protein